MVSKLTPSVEFAAGATRSPLCGLFSHSSGSGDTVPAGALRVVPAANSFALGGWRSEQHRLHRRAGERELGAGVQRLFADGAAALAGPHQRPPGGGAGTTDALDAPLDVHSLAVRARCGRGLHGSSMVRGVTAGRGAVSVRTRHIWQGAAATLDSGAALVAASSTAPREGMNPPAETTGSPLKQARIGQDREPASAGFPFLQPGGSSPGGAGPAMRDAARRPRRPQRPRCPGTPRDAPRVAMTRLVPPPRRRPSPSVAVLPDRVSTGHGDEVISVPPFCPLKLFVDYYR